MAKAVVRTAAVLVLLGGAPVDPVAAQVTPAGVNVFTPGTRVRLVVAGPQPRIVTGTINHYAADTVVVDTIDLAETRRTFFPTTVTVDEYRRVALPLADVDSVQVSVGRSRALGMLFSGAKYALVGGLLVGVKNVSGTPNPSLRQFGQGAAVGATLGVSIGMSFGYARGAERWRSIPYFGGLIRRPPGKSAVSAR